MATADASPLLTVLVLGAGGFIGTRLVEALRVSGGFRPIAAPRRPTSAFHPDVEVRPCDATARIAMEAALQGVDYVVNCIAGPNQGMVAATRSLCDVAPGRALRRVVHLSSMAVYGAATGRVTEDTPAKPPLSGYGQAKWRCEQIIQAYIETGGDAVILRPSCVHGPGSPQWTWRIARLLQAGRIGDLGSAGDGICNLIYIDDLVSAVIAALSRPGLGGKVLNVSHAEAGTWNEFLVRSAQALGIAPVRHIAPYRLALESQVFAPVLQTAAILARRVGLPPHRIPEAITPGLVRLWRQDIRLGVEEYKHWLDVPQTSLDQALLQAAQWVAQEG